MNYIQNLNYLTPEIIIIISCLTILVISVLSKNIAKYSSILSIIALLLSGIKLVEYINIQEIIISDFFKINSFTVIVKLIIIIVTSLLLFLYQNSSYYKNYGFEFPIIILFSVVGMMLMISSNDFLSMYLSLELQSLCLYVLSAFDRDKSQSSEAGIKYFTLGVIASSILLFGISLIYGFSGLTNFTELSNNLNNIDNIPIGILIGMVMIITGIAFKISAAPFHLWTADVYQGSPNIVTCFLSTSSKIASICLLMNIFSNIFNGGWYQQWSQIIILLSILSMFVGSIGAVIQNSIKRILAYSSIGHIGYMLMGIASNNQYIEIIIYIAIYASLNIGIFAFIFMNSENDDIDVRSLSGLSKKYPVIAITVACILLSMAGIPPFAGFFTKLYIFKLALNQKLYYLTIIAILNSLISTYYYLRIIKIMYFDETNENYLLNINKSNIIILILASLINITFPYIIDRLQINF